MVEYEKKLIMDLMIELLRKLDGRREKKTNLQNSHVGISSQGGPSSTPINDNFKIVNQSHTRFGTSKVFRTERDLCHFFTIWVRFYL